MVLANTISKMSHLICHEMHSSFSPGSLAQENLASPLTRSSPKVSAVTWNHSRLTLVNFLDRWISQMLISSKAFHLLSPSIRNQLIVIHAQPWEQLLRSMTTSVYFSLGPVDHIVRNVRNLYRDRVHNRLLIRFLSCHRQQNFKFSHQ